MRNNTLVLCGLLVGLGTSAAAQSPRNSIQLDTTTPLGVVGSGSDIATVGDLSIAVFSDVGTNHVYAVRSDGRGAAWSAPVQIDTDTTGALKTTGFHDGSHSVHVVGDNVYTIWVDERNGAGFESDVFFSRSLDGGQTWQPEVRLDDGFTIGFGNPIADYAMDVSPDIAGDHIYVFMAVTNIAPEELYLVASHDSGATFGPAVPVSTGNGATDHDEIHMCADGLNVHCVWSDARAGDINADDLFYRRSIDGGATFQPELQLDSSGAFNGDVALAPNVDCSGSLVAVIWQEELTSPSNEEVRVAVSTNGGASFAADMLVGNYTAGTNDVDATAIRICGGNIIAAWDDDRLGGDAVFASVSTDAGATWNPDVQINGPGGTGFPRFTRAAGTVVGLSMEGTTSPHEVEASFSRDCGQTWSSSFVASKTTGDADDQRVEYNALYNNFIHVWSADDLGENHVYAGGYRPQTLGPTPEPVAAFSSFNFNLSGFEPGFANRFFFVLLSSGPGSLPLAPIDPRDVGLTFGPYLLTSLQVPALFFGPLDALGQGSSPSFPMPLPPNSTLVAAAVSFSAAAGVTTVHEITDVESISVQ